MLYMNKCSQESCKDYIGEAGRCFSERTKDHGGRDTKSNVSKHSTEKQQLEITQKDFKVIGSHFRIHKK